MQSNIASMQFKKRIYLDDIRTPKEETGDWLIARNYEQFVEIIEREGLENISMITLDHDLGDTAMKEYFNNVSPNYKLDYNNIQEKTGYDCAKWLVNHFVDLTESGKTVEFPDVYTHSANPIGSANIMGYINNFLMNTRRKQTCVRISVAHTV
jgi:hypothetical protein